jgi:hypothetical protein
MPLGITVVLLVYLRCPGNGQREDGGNQCLHHIDPLIRNKNKGVNPVAKRRLAR